MQLNNQNQNYPPQFNNINTFSPINSPKYSSTNNILYNSTLDNPSNINTQSSKQLFTNNSRSINLKKFASINDSKNSILNSSSISKYPPVSGYISCSTLQAGEAISYSIPKSTRFKNPNQNSYSDSVYHLPELKSTGVTIGNSPRRELWDSEKANIPSPHDYVFTSVFEDNLAKNKGYTIANKHEIKVKVI